MDSSSEMKTEDATTTVHDSYLNQLLAESKQLDPSLTLCHQLLAQGKFYIVQNINILFR